MSDQSERLKAIGEYLEKMTPGPWNVGRWKIGDNPWSPLIGCEIGAPVCRFDRFGVPERDKADAEGIAALRTDAPWLRSELLAEIRKREEAERLLDHVWSEHMDDEEIAACAMKLDVMRVLKAAGGCDLPGHESETKGERDA